MKGKEGFVPGVAVVIKGSAVGTVTDPEGKFVIKAEKGDVLNFLMVGYKTFEYKVEKTENNLVIVLQPDDVVAVGSEKMEDLDNNLQVIGVRTADGKQPLYIVDGVEMKDENELKKIDKNIIESISVLKNASATAVYGDKGKDGVVIITTKKGTNVRVEGVQGNLVGINSDVKESELSLRGVSEGTKPLIVLDGEVKGKDFELNTIKPDEIESISVLKGNSAVQLYGDDAKDGAILITMKKVKIIISEDRNLEALKSLHKDVLPLYIVDGKKLPKDFDVNLISPSDIKSASILKDKDAIKLYGDEGKGDVILITTKNPEKYTFLFE